MAIIEGSAFRNTICHILITLREEGSDRLFFYCTRYLSWKLQLHYLVRTFPKPIATLIYVWLRRIVRRTVWLLNEIYPDKYTDADPYKLIFVDPSVIERTTENIHSKRRGWVVGGDWDMNGEPFMQRPYSQGIKQRFAENLVWSDTVFANKYNGRKFKNRTDSIEQLYQYIMMDGYKTQHELLKENSKIAWDGLNDAMHPLANEIAVDIGRNGELLWNHCGQHRLAIAKILDVDQIPVQVFRRHVKWQKIRYRAQRGEEIPETVRDHPDLVDVLENE